MSDPSLALQKGILDAIVGLATAAGNRVYDDVPPKAKFPYVVLGDAQLIPQDESCADMTEVFMDIDVWTRSDANNPTGYPQTKAIGGAIRDRLHEGNLVLSGYTLSLMVVEDLRYERDPDGITRRARISVRALTMPDP